MATVPKANGQPSTSPSPTESHHEDWHPFDVFNETNAKRVAFILVLLLLAGHSLRRHWNPYDSCSALFEGGAYLGPGTWQPEGCTLHHYSIKDAPQCLKDKRIIIMGDSRMRQLFYSLLNIASVQAPEEAKVHSDIHHHEKDTNTDIEYWWLPELNDTTGEAYSKRLLQAEAKPLFVVHGVGTWTIKLNDGSPTALEQFQKNLTKMAPVMDDVASQMPLIWMLQAPVEKELLWDTRKMITNEQLDQYNSVAETVLADTHVHMWHSSVTIATGTRKETVDGLHLADQPIGDDVQILLNRFCNKQVNPTDATCCVDSSAEMNFVQQATFCFFLIMFIFAVFLKIQALRRERLLRSSSLSNADAEAANHAAEKSEAGKKEEPHWVDTWYTCTSHLARYGVVMAYFYICDRTDLFPKRQKFYSSNYFFFSVSVAFLLCVFFHKTTKKPSILNLDQTKEWKGWMQICILIYHYCGASKVVPIYMHLRLMVASYLFMTAYGQFCASWDKNKFGLPRVCNVIFRMNLLVFFLCLVMDRQYQLYYFVPLVSFWFLVIYGTMAIYPRVTRQSAEGAPRHYFYMLAKLLALVCLITFLSFSRVTFNLTFEWWPFSELFTWPGSSLYEWWFRWNLDKYIVPYGMVFAFGLLTLRSFKWLDDSHSGDLFSPFKSIVIQLITAAVFFLSSVHFYRCTSKPECNRIHSYTSFIPITAFIVLRNTSGFIRQRFSVFAAWFGDISLELFIAQYHIWLATDTKSLLVLIPGFPHLNLLVTSFIFLCVAIELKDLTGVLTAMAIPGDAWKLYPRLLVFLLLLSSLLVYSAYLR
ncbi:N-acetylneuraminate (7)9-O-acetyltransferase-like [Diadema antillarum]|uniref:N-acetylneuraminate (7)9-O-acetyltransferase-like n=1 Tax=Diadema antillarum TaxID=105358 RepID=UPI003A89EBF1